MHEMSLCEGILRILKDEAARHRFQRVLRVRLEVGALAAVEPEALRFGFDVVMKHSLAEGAALEIALHPALAWCFQCMETVEVRQRIDPCPRCGSYQLQVTEGEELKIKDLEVE